MMWDVIVVGAGCAGLAAGTRLAELGHRVLVLERRPILGGRASSFEDKNSGEILDNGQHLFLGCYKETKTYLTRIKSDHLLPFRRTFSTVMCGLDGQRAKLKTAPLPAPFHLAWGLLNYSALSWKDRVRMYSVAKDASSPSQDLSLISVNEWLHQLGQSQVARARFWNPITLATINVSPDRAPAELLAIVLRQGFLASPEASAVGLATVGLSDLHGKPSQKFIMQRRGDVRIKTAVKRILFQEKDVQGVELANGSIERSHIVISAVPPPAALKFIEHGNHSLRSKLSSIEELTSSPIVSLHVWVNQQPFDEVFVGLWNSEFHWIFRKNAIYQDSNSQHVTLVASAAEKMLAKTKEELIQIAEKELNAISRLKNVKILRAVLSRESSATWVPPIGNPEVRPNCETQVKNFFLAGDWTNTGLPATIEGAVKSGHEAAEKSHTWLTRQTASLTLPLGFAKVPRSKQI